MKSTLNITFVLLYFFIATHVNAQLVPKKIVVEHFTNTRCGICAANNPGFYSALSQKNNVLHIAFHPSSPYSTCLFSTQNKSENDARTNYYGIYGGTPVFVINGSIRSASQVQNIQAYDIFENQLSPISIKTKLSSTSENIIVNVEIKAEENNNLGNARLYIALVEDTVWYNAPNGENIHHDVFRKSFSGNDPVSFNVPSVKGNTYLYQSTIPKNLIWKSDRLSAMAIVSSSDKIVLQADQSLQLNATLSSTDIFTSNPKLDIKISPNPVTNILKLTSTNTSELLAYQVIDIHGKGVLSGNFSGVETVINIENIPKGQYLIHFRDQKSKNQTSQPFIKY